MYEVYQGPLSNIYDGAFFENIELLQAVNYFCKKSPSWLFAGVLNMSLVKKLIGDLINRIAIFYRTLNCKKACKSDITETRGIIVI